MGHFPISETARNKSRAPLARPTLEPIWKEVESLESVMIPCLAPDLEWGAACGRRRIAGQRSGGVCATTVT